MTITISSQPVKQRLCAHCPQAGSLTPVDIPMAQAKSVSWVAPRTEAALGTHLLLGQCDSRLRSLEVEPSSHLGNMFVAVHGP